MIKGFPGLLNTIRTLLDRSQTIKQIFKKMPKHEGSHDPRKPWAQNHEIIKIIKSHENHCFFQHGKDAHRDSEKVALTTAPDH